MRSIPMTWLVAAVLTSSSALAGCDDATAGPMVLQGHGGMVVDPANTSVWFPVSGCLVEGSDPVDVMVTSVTTSPASDRVATEVTWNDERPVVIAKPGQPPAAYQPVTTASHTGGTLDGCSLDVAVVLSPDTDPVAVRTVTVSYTVDGEEYSARTPLDATLCPEGTRASGGTGDGCRGYGGS